MPDYPVPLRLLPFPEGRFLVNDADVALTRVVVSSRTFYHDMIGDDPDAVVMTTRPYVEVRDLPGKSRTPLEPYDPMEDGAQLYWLEEALWADGRQADRANLVLGRAPNDAVRARIFGAEADPVWGYAVVVCPRAVIRSDPGGVRYADGRVEPPEASAWPMTQLRPGG